MRTARRQPRATHRPPTAASRRGLLSALHALYGAAPTLPASEAEQQYAQLRSSRPYERKQQGDLVLVLPEAGAE